jgi:hypothetical protein
LCFRLSSSSSRASGTDRQRKNRIGDVLTRRHFGTAIASLAAGSLWAESRIPVAIQLFSLRRQCEQDLGEDAGIHPRSWLRRSRTCRFYGRTADQFKALLDEHSLACSGSHTPLPELTGAKFDNTVEANWARFIKVCDSEGATEWFIIEHDCSHREEAKICFEPFQRLRARRH